jgi:hypothetical protein
VSSDRSKEHGRGKQDLKIGVNNGLLSVRWFDKAYLSKRRAKLVKALLKYVLANKKQFVD